MMDAVYVKRTVGDALVRAMAVIAERRPVDPIHHLSVLLQSEYEHQRKQKQEQDAVDLQHQQELTEEKESGDETTSKTAEEIVGIKEAAAKGYALLSSTYPSTISMFASPLSAIVCSDTDEDQSTGETTDTDHKEAEGSEISTEETPTASDQTEEISSTAPATETAATKEPTYASLSTRYPSTIAMFATPMGSIQKTTVATSDTMASSSPSTDEADSKATEATSSGSDSDRPPSSTYAKLSTEYPSTISMFAIPPLEAQTGDKLDMIANASSDNNESSA
eukprot:m.104051 g.104051  ORF g.104051 m.104051 type:complete len:279 (-) comp15062_c6_seq1:167-1003(-)